jgi:hypothetical protein
MTFITSCTNNYIGPYFFEQNLTGGKYLNFLRKDLPRLLENVPLAIPQRMIFQHDGATITT